MSSPYAAAVSGVDAPAWAKPPPPERHPHNRNDYYGDDRKPPAKGLATIPSKRPFDGSNAATTTTTRRPDNARRRRLDFLTPLPIGTHADPHTASSPPPSHLLIGKGAAVWNAHLEKLRQQVKDPSQYPHAGETKGTRSSSPDSARVSVLEILQQAQERLGLPPTRFPPRDSPLHQIFQSKAESLGDDREIFAPLEECYRAMLEQDASLEERLRKEYQPLVKPQAKALLQKRAGQIFAQAARLQKEEQDLLVKVKEGLEGFLGEE